MKIRIQKADEYRLAQQAHGHTGVDGVEGAIKATEHHGLKQVACVIPVVSETVYCREGVQAK